MTEKLAVDPIDRLSPEDIESFCSPPVATVDDVQDQTNVVTDDSSLDSLGVEKVKKDGENGRKLR